ncbi:Uncharacterized protein Adt_15287 [Abeliophyllum distichum]|uniref:Uncharacterized protein n=1 Tax=Abeliophyllum distichum TaxID=126358 RepID=A0ABD1U217_9LAMI
MFAGHLGELELVSLKLANSWAAVSGFAPMVQSCLSEYLWGSTEGTTTHALETITITFLSQLQHNNPLITVTSTSVSFTSFFFTTADRPASITKGTTTRALSP